MKEQTCFYNMQMVYNADVRDMCNSGKLNCILFYFYIS